MPLSVFGGLNKLFILIELNFGYTDRNIVCFIQANYLVKDIK